MLRDDDLRTDKYTLAGGATAYVLTHLPTLISARDEDIDKPVMERLTSLRKRLEVCVDVLKSGGIETTSPEVR